MDIQIPLHHSFPLGTGTDNEKEWGKNDCTISPLKGRYRSKKGGGSSVVVIDEGPCEVKMLGIGTPGSGVIWIIRKREMILQGMWRYGNYNLGA